MEAGDFGDFGDSGEIGDFGKNHQRAGDMWQNIQIGCPEMHAMAKMAKNHQITSLWRFELNAKSGLLEAGDFGEIGDFGKNRQRAGDMWQNIQIGCQKWPLQSR